MKTAIASGTLFFLALSGLACAGEMQGTVKKVDMENHRITLRDGMSVTTNGNVKRDGVMAGDHVRVTTDGDHMGTMVEKMK